MLFLQKQSPSDFFFFYVMKINKAASIQHFTNVQSGTAADRVFQNALLLVFCFQIAVFSRGSCHALHFGLFSGTLEPCPDGRHDDPCWHLERSLPWPTLSPLARDLQWGPCSQSLLLKRNQVKHPLFILRMIWNPPNWMSTSILLNVFHSNSDMNSF